jgi:hypothetical protein
MAEERIIDMLQEIKTRVVILEKEKDDATPGPRVQLFFKQMVEPIERSVQGIERAVEKQAGQVATLTDQSKELYQAHKDFLVREQQRKDAEAARNTIPATLLRWGAYAGALGGIWLVFKVLGILLDAYLKARGFTP